MSREIGGGIVERGGERVANASLRGEVNDPIDIFGRERCHGFTIGDVDFLETKAGTAHQPVEPRLLQGWAVIGIEIVDPQHLLTTIKQRAGDMGADEAGGAGDENGQCGLRQWASGCSLPSAHRQSVYIHVEPGGFAVIYG